MLLKKKGNEIFSFENEEELKNYCAESNAVNLRMFQDFDISKYNKRTKRFERIKSNKV